MIPRLRYLVRSAVGVAIYLACTALVCSFILFEVLDIDGSDFPGRHASTATAATLSEAAHDIRRAFLKGPPPVGVEVSVVFVGRSAECVRAPHPAASTPSSPASQRARGTRLTLPRASLADPPPSA